MRILFVVTASSDLFDQLRKVFEDRYTVRHYTGKLSAVNKVIQENPHLIIIDQATCDSYELSDIIKNEYKMDQVSTLALFQEANQFNKIRSKLVYLDDFEVFPLDSQELFQKVFLLVEKAEKTRVPAKQNTISLGYSGYDLFETPKPEKSSGGFIEEDPFYRPEAQRLNVLELDPNEPPKEIKIIQDAQQHASTNDEIPFKKDPKEKAAPPQEAPSPDPKATPTELSLSDEEYMSLANQQIEERLEFLTNDYVEYLVRKAVEQKLMKALTALAPKIHDTVRKAVENELTKRLTPEVVLAIAAKKKENQSS